jgi:Na+/H+ antiporter NhaD/arsenite permease-like protein
MAFVVTVFVLVYLGMVLGRVPGLALDRTGIALLGALALIAHGDLSTEAAWEAVDVSTIGLLLGLMVVSAQFRLGGFYSMVTQRVAALPLPPAAFLGALIAVVGLLSAVLTNDIICLAMTPLLADGCARRGLNPLPCLIALACAANIGSAATLIGNPQNMLIGQALHLSFAGYLGIALPVAVAGLGALWLILRVQYRGRWQVAIQAPHPEARPFSAWQSGKGLAVLSAALLAFLFTPWPREVIALAAAGALLVSRRMHSREMLGCVDWQLLVLFAALFMLNHGLAGTGAVARALHASASAGIDVTSPPWLFGLSAVLSNLVSNVPATMLLLPAATHPLAAPVLALSSTLAGNFIIVGSIANIIVAEQARPLGITLTWREHAATGIPVTLVTLAMAAGWLAAWAAFTG